MDTWACGLIEIILDTECYPYRLIQKFGSVTTTRRFWLYATAEREQERAVGNAKALIGLLGDARPEYSKSLWVGSEESRISDAWRLDA